MVITVNPGESIQDAVVAASPGDTILVRPGVYNEAVAINKNGLRVIGSGSDKTILDGTGIGAANGFVIFGASFITIEGFTVRNFAGVGILTGTDDNVIRYNYVTQNEGAGISLHGSRNLVERNTVKRNGADGIVLGLTTTHNYVIGNEVHDHPLAGINSTGTFALLLENRLCHNNPGMSVGGAGSWVIDNTVTENNTDGVQSTANFTFLADNESSKNELLGWLVSGDGIVGANNKVNRNGSHGVAVSSAAFANSVLFANELSYNSGDGFHGGITQVNTLLVANDVDENKDDGIDLDGGDSNRVLFNDIDDNKGRGIDIDEDADNNIVDDNRVDDNHGSGIRLDPDGNGNAVRGNKLGGNRPYDILAEPPAISNNVLDLNECGRSSPNGICD